MPEAGDGAAGPPGDGAAQPPGGRAGSRAGDGEGLGGSARDERARAALRPLGAGERPGPLLTAIAVCALLAIAVVAGALSVHDLSRHGGSRPGAAFLALILLVLAQGMYRRSYWAVLGFEALLAFQILVTSLALVVASTVLAATACVVSIALGGWLFWRLIRVMGRIQAGEGEQRSTPGKIR
jgi:hypothetical protein